MVAYCLESLKDGQWEFRKAAEQQRGGNLLSVVIHPRKHECAERVVLLACWFAACFFAVFFCQECPGFLRITPSSSHTRESLPNKAPCSIGSGAKKNLDFVARLCLCCSRKDKMASLNFTVEAHRDRRTWMQSLCRFEYRDLLHFRWSLLRRVCTNALSVCGVSKPPWQLCNDGYGATNRCSRSVTQRPWR